MHPKNFEGRRDPSNRSLYEMEYMIYIGHNPDSNSQPVQSQALANSSK